MENDLEQLNLQIAIQKMQLRLSRITPDINGCMIWTGARSHGYGSIFVNYKRIQVHRLVVAVRDNLDYYDYTWVTLHSCDNPSCVNKDHLRKGTQSENQKDSVIRKRHYRSRKTHCYKGHMFSPDNTSYTYLGDRVCMQCQRDGTRMRKTNAKKENSTSINSDPSSS